MRHMYVIEQGERLYGPFVDPKSAIDFGETQFAWGAATSWSLRPVSPGSDRIDDDDDEGYDEDSPSLPQSTPEEAARA